MIKIKYHKCRYKRGSIDYCPTLFDRVEPEANSYKKGMIQINVTNFKTGKVRVIGVAYKMTSQDKGIMFNNCPFCGENLLFEKIPKNDKRRK